MREKMSGRILLVDDEREIADLIETFLQNEQFQCFKYHTFQEAFLAASRECFDLAIIDIMLPDGDGFVLCREIRKKHTYPIILLTSKIEGADRVTGLSLGADDYVTKPFLPIELVARVKAHLRRVHDYDGKENGSNEIVTIAGLLLNKTSHECKLDGERIRLTPTEFSILWLLCKNRGKVYSADELFQIIWGEKYFKNSRNTVMVQIRHIREKLNDISEKPKFIKTIWGVGYIVE